jgi:hypothetical protein
VRPDLNYRQGAHTSEQQIRKHYAALILGYTDEITRKTLPSLGPPVEPPASNVVKLRIGQRACGRTQQRRHMLVWSFSV